MIVLVSFHWDPNQETWWLMGILEMVRKNPGGFNGHMIYYFCGIFHAATCVYTGGCSICCLGYWFLWGWALGILLETGCFDTKDGKHGGSECRKKNNQSWLTSLLRLDMLPGCFFMVMVYPLLNMCYFGKCHFFFLVQWCAVRSESCEQHNQFSGFAWIDGGWKYLSAHLQL